MRRSGFTLTEMMVAMTVGSLMLAGLMVTSTSLQRWFASADYRIGTQQDEATILDYLARDIRRASACSVQNSGLELVLTMPDQTVRAGDVTLQAPAFNQGAIQYGLTPTTVSYYVQAGTNFVREDAAGVLTLSSQIETFQADVSALPSISVQLAFAPGPRQAVGRTVTTIIRWRNLAGRLQ